MDTMQRGTNAGGMRRYNERLILSAVRRMNGASKAELARATALSPQAVVRIVDDLDTIGLLFQAGKRTGGMGQPATIYRINGERGHTIGVEVGRGDTTLVLLDFDGQRKAVCRHAGSFPSIDTVLRHIDAFIAEHLASADLSNSEVFMGIGIAMPWFLGEWRDELGISDDQADEWRQADVADRLQAGLAQPAFFENDGNASALAQLLCGVGVDLQDFLAVNIGTFVGGGLVLGDGSIKAVTETPAPWRRCPSTRRARAIISSTMPRSTHLIRMLSLRSVPLGSNAVSRRSHS